MKITVAQINTTNGDISGNVGKIIAAIEKARKEGSELIVFPELVTHGYMSLDWFQDHDVVAECERPIEAIRGSVVGITAVIGTVRQNDAEGKRLFNTAVVIKDREILGFADKTLLPEYDIFDDARYFEKADSQKLFDLDGKKLGVVVCEDFWNDKTFWKERLYGFDPTEEVINLGADLVVALNASPFNRGKVDVREAMVAHRAKSAARPVVFVNLVGGNDGVVFDGGSLVVDGNGRSILRAPVFEEFVGTVDTSMDLPDIVESIPEMESIRRALVLGIGDYARKNNFSKAVIGLSGGIDSALVTVLACEALGPENVLAVMMPSQFSSEGSIIDSMELVKNLGCDHRTEPINDAYSILISQLNLADPKKAGESLAAENLQSRLRGMLLMAISNTHGRLLLSTGNKSELAVGYCTLYGDTNGALAVLGDILKTEVWELSKHINATAKKELIPESIISKRPSAELAPNQYDDDSLPPYAAMDPILKLYFEEKLSPDEIADHGHEREFVLEILDRVEHPSNEFKRRQLPPSIIVSKNAIGIGRRRPISHRFSRIKRDI